MGETKTMGDKIPVPDQGTHHSTRLTHQRGQDSGNGLWSVRMADTYIEQRPLLLDEWSYESGVVLKGIEQVWIDTGAKKYWEYIQRNIDEFVDADGKIRTYTLQDYNLDQINTGKLFFRLHQETGDDRYRQAIHLLIEQLKTQPRTSEGGFWHKKIYPYQMWLDGIYMAAPFYAQYASCFDEPEGFDDAAHQILLAERHTRDSKTGLFYHGWDESKMQKWANPQTGCSPHFWGRAMGWYAMALVDVLDFLPETHRARDRIVTILDRMLSSLMLVQDEATGLWYQVLDQGERQGNYTEASASCMFVYAIAKGYRNWYVAPRYLTAARKAYEGIIKSLVRMDEYGHVELARTCRVAGLGRDPHRDGSYEYYLREPVVTNDPKGVGAFILASAEMDKLNQHD